MWARVKLDVAWADLAFGLHRCVMAPERVVLEQAIERRSSPTGSAFVCLSVRTAFDLTLHALALPAGSEILFSALNIKGMVKIARRLELVPVPLDLELDCMLPTPESVERALTQRTRALVVAPLFGTRGDLSALIATARGHGLRVIEDCAQAFSGLGYAGHPEADVSMFSFGPLKFATALGGALVHVRDPALLEAMRNREASYPALSTSAYAVRLLEFAALKAVSTRPVLGALTGALRLVGLDYEDALAEPVRGVASLGSPSKLRRRCPTAMLALLERRLLGFDAARFETRSRVGRRLLELLDENVVCPAARSRIHHFWAFPILVENPDTVMYALRRAGFDAATLRRSATVAPPVDRPWLDPVVARDALAHLLVLPCYEGMPERELRRLAEVVRLACAASACNRSGACA